MHDLSELNLALIKISIELTYAFASISSKYISSEILHICFRIIFFSSMEKRLLFLENIHAITAECTFSLSAIKIESKKLGVILYLLKSEKIIFIIQIYLVDFTYMKDYGFIK